MRDIIYELKQIGGILTNIKVFKNYDELSAAAAQLVVREIANNPDMVLGLPTGGTPVGMYRNLVELYENDQVDFSEVAVFNLDEYLGLDRNHPQSYHYYMNQLLYSKVNLLQENIFIPDGMTHHVETECQVYDQLINDYGNLDMLIMGIGQNGHIGFNEPGAEFISPTHLIALNQSTIDANSRFFDSMDEVPEYAITMGLRSIMHAKQIILLASGKNKAEAVYKAVCGNVTPQVPASILQYHRHAVLLLDEDAASLLQR